MGSTMASMWYARIGAVLGWATLAIQLWIILLSRWETQASLVGGVVSMFSYFTILTNTLVAVVFTQVAWGRPGKARAWFLSARISSGIAAAIALVGLAYNILLRHLWSPEGLQWLCDEMLHDVLPLMYLVWWGWQVPKGQLRLADIGRWMAYPVGYFIYAMWRGYSLGVYPYPFIDAEQLGYGRALVNALGVLLGFVAIALLVLAMDHWLGARRARPVDQSSS